MNKRDTHQLERDDPEYAGLRRHHRREVRKQKDYDALFKQMAKAALKSYWEQKQGH